MGAVEQAKINQGIGFKYKLPPFKKVSLHYLPEFLCWSMAGGKRLHKICEVKASDRIELDIKYETEQLNNAEFNI